MDSSPLWEARLTLTARGDDVKSEKRRGGKSNIYFLHNFPPSQNQHSKYIHYSKLLVCILTSVSGAWRCGWVGRRGGELIKVKSGDFSGKSFRYCNVTTQPGGSEDCYEEQNILYYKLARRSHPAVYKFYFFPFIQLCLIKFQASASKSDTLRLDKDLFMKHTGTIFSFSRVLVSWFIYLFSFQRCGDAWLSWLCLFSVSGCPGPRGASVGPRLLQGSADLLQKPKQFSAATWQVSGGWVTSDTWWELTSRGSRSTTAREGFIIIITIRTFRILWPTLDQFQRQSWELIHFILEHQKLLRHTAVQCGNKRNRNTRQ